VTHSQDRAEAFRRIKADPPRAREVVHVVGATGMFCELCKELVSAWPVGAGVHMVVLDGDPRASWWTGRAPTCSRSSRTPP